ncbi:MAG: YbaB/EbfC family nucleoid-associated protein [Peptococcaceae bacterium]|nr:YbaB/EbfC family nucleoid-associated protein [Peptococcaceae bacterium]
MANMQNMMKQMQKMQREMAKLQEELAQTPVTGTAGGGACKVTVNGANQMLAVELAPEVVDPDDIDMLQDLIVAATNDAMQSAQKLSEERMGSLTKGMKLPGGMGGLF